jgi:hypothetical protein
MFHVNKEKYNETNTCNLVMSYHFNTNLVPARKRPTNAKF